MPVVHTPESAFAQEMRKWNAHHSEYGPPGRPYTYQEYPTRMYKAARKPDGTRAIVEAQTADDYIRRRILESQGFVMGGQQAALDALEAQELEAAKLAAEINFEARRMSDRARQEVESAQDAAGARHLPEIPETPLRKRGRPRKADLVTGADLE